MERLRMDYFLLLYVSAGYDIYIAQINLDTMFMFTSSIPFWIAAIFRHVL
jgi:hypothetical protein